MNVRRTLGLITIPILACVSSIAAFGSDATPTTPTGLIANAYGDTAGGIRWERSSDDKGAVSAYEVTRDGEVVAVRDALSYVDLTLSPSTTYTYGVTAIDNADQRSGTATVELRTTGVRPSTSLAPPSDLHASVYSSTAAEIFWARPPSIGLRYEISRDGELRVVTAGTSFFDDTLQPGKRYRYDVVAIDRGGQRSVASSVTLATLGAPSSTVPAAPVGISASVYSSTAAEIFWARSSVVGLRYQVARDGESLIITDGTSFFDSSLQPGTRYRYDVVAIDRDGQRSAPSSLALTTLDDPFSSGDDNNPFAEPAPDGRSVIARLGYPAAIEGADNLVSTSYLRRYYDIDRTLTGLLRGDPSGQGGSTVACPEGGEASGAISFFSFDVLFVDCVVDGVRLNGGLAREAEFTVFGLGDVQRVLVTFDGLKIDAGTAGTLEVTGSSARFDERFANTDCGGAARRTRRVENRIDTARIEGGSTEVRVHAANWKQLSVTGLQVTGEPSTGSGPPTACTAFENLEFEGETTAEAAHLGGEPSTIEKRGALFRDAQGDEFSSASARIDARFGDGSTLFVNLTSDPQREVQVDILAEGIALSFSDIYAFEARDEIPPILGD